MSDCISREAVKNWLKRWEGYLDGDMIARMQYRVCDIPSVIPKAEWIPVSERLPESAGVYIVTREFTDGFTCADLADACYFDGTSTWHNDNRINHDREYVDKKIKAWMPLPEPWDGEE